MGGLLGTVRLDGGFVDRAIIDRLKKSEKSSRTLRLVSDSSWACIYAPPPYLAADRYDAQPFGQAGMALFVEGRLDERDALIAALDKDAARRSDPRLIADAYQRWGPAAHERLYGEFAVAMWDAAERRLTLVRDALGTRALYYHFDGTSVWFATSLHHLLTVPEVPRSLDELGLADFLVCAAESPERTLYRDIFRVPPGGTVSFRAGERRMQLYFTLEGIAPVRFRHDEDYVEIARTLLDKAVASRLPASGAVATTLSGGLDSAAVTATAARLMGERSLTAITRVAGAHDPYRRHHDERALAGLVAARYANVDWVVADELHRHDRTLSPEWDAAAMGAPVAVQAMTWFEPVDRRAQAMGACVLLSGGRGNATLSWAGNGLCFEQVRGGKLFGAMREVALGARRSGEPTLPALRRQLTATIEPRAMRRRRRTRRSEAEGYGPWQIKAMLAPDFLASVDYAAHADSIGHDMLRDVPRTGREMRWAMMQRQQPADRQAWLRSRTPHELLDPFRDRRLTEFTLGVPENQYRRNGTDRWLARRVLADRLPAELLAQDRRGVQNGEWYHLATLQREQTAEAIERLAKSPLASRVLNVAFLKSLIDTWPRDAEAAMYNEREHRHMLEFGVSVGSFLRWYEGSNG